jgi:glycosyltransferase involved in cell wall biosynthesis
LNAPYTDLEDRAHGASRSLDVKLSVIVPSRNVAPHMEAAVCSVLDQNFRNIEVIAVDDSTDDTHKIFHQIAQRGAGLKIMCDTNTGVAPTRNIGFKVARGQYMGFFGRRRSLASKE